MNTALRRLLGVSAVWLAASAALGQSDTGAKKDGYWNDRTVWTGGAIPGGDDNVYIGSNSPSGAAAVATVTLDRNRSAANLYLGNGAGASGTIDLADYRLNVLGEVSIGTGGGVGNVARGSGWLKANSLAIDSANVFAFGARDSVADLALYGGSQAATVATHNVSGNVLLYNNSKLTLGAASTLSGDLVAEDNSIVDAVRHSITAGRVLLGYYGAAPASLQNGRSLTANELRLGNGSTADFRAAGTVVNNAVALSGGSVLTLTQLRSNLTGLTFNGASAADLAIDGASRMELKFANSSDSSWIFRWKDAAGDNWIDELAGLIDDGKIAVTGRYGYRLYDSAGYTYVGSPVPAPATLVGLLQLGGIAAAAALWRRRRCDKV